MFEVVDVDSDNGQCEKRYAVRKQWCHKQTCLSQACCFFSLLSLLLKLLLRFLSLLWLWCLQNALDAQRSMFEAAKELNIPLSRGWKGCKVCYVISPVAGLNNLCSNKQQEKTTVNTGNARPQY